MSVRRRAVLGCTLLALLALVATGFASPARAATWCGSAATTDRPEQASAGYSIHLVYAIPSDGTDRLATLASAMQTDAETTDQWWRREDPTRAPRFDTFAFACGTQLDITTLRLPQSGAELDPIDGRFLKIYQSLQAPTLLLSPYEKTVVYYDGPDSQGRPTVCGEGGGPVAFVYVNACEGVPNDAIIAHELIHSLGAVPSGAPHNCPPPDDGHTCDNTVDIMYPFADDSNLFALLLDPGRDDYYGHSGSWLDVQDSEYLVRLDQQTPLQLTVQGAGHVTSDIPGVDCTAACSTRWNTGTALALRATPAAGQRFVRWSGGCAGPTPQCNVSLAQATQVTGLFAPETYALRVSVTGKGVVRGGAGQVECPTFCRVSLESYTPTRLVAKAAKGWRFKAWSGTCSGTRATCTLPMRKASSARATFVRVKKS
jgi:List-Bact-rpt repeat protein